MDIAGMFKNLMNWQPAGSPEWSNIQGAKQKQQQLDIQKQQEDRAARQSDQDFAEHMQSIGAKPIFHGLVRDEAPLPDMGVSVPIYRPPNEERLRTKQKTATGDNVEWEVPNEQEQLLHHAMMNAQGFKLGAPVREAQLQEGARTAQANAQGAATGRGQGMQTDLQLRGVPLSDELADYYHLPKGWKVLPEQMDQLSQRATPAQIRGDASTANTTIRADGQKDIAQVKADAQSQRDAAMNDFKKQQAEIKLQHQDAWQRARTAVASSAQGNINARTNLRLFDADQKQHSGLVDNAFKEQQKALQAQSLLDEQDTPGLLGGTSKSPAVKDGEEFTDPWSGKKMTMNYAQRLRLKNALGESQAQVVSLRERADKIAQKRGLNAQPGGAGGDQTGGGDTVRIKTGDGRVGTMPKANLEKAKQADPKLQVLP